MASKSKRDKQLAAERAQRQAARREAEQSRRQRRTRAVALVTVVALIAAAGAGLGFALTQDDAQAEAPDLAAAGCEYRPSDGPAETDAGLPPAEPVAAATMTLELDGDPVTVDLAAESAPCAVGSMAYLSAEGYYDGTTCNRLTTADSLQVLQCGDPTNTGAGGPGYRYDDEVSPDTTYPPGTVAVANAGPNSNGSQFFVVYGAANLPPGYTVLGTVTDGLDVVEAIAADGVAGGGTDGQPKTTVTLESVEVS